MNILIQGGRVVDPASGFDAIADLALVDARVEAIDSVANSFRPDRVIDAQGCVVAPGLVDLAVRLREPGHEHARMLESEMAAAVAGGVCSLVCPPDTEPVLDEPGLVEMLRFRAEKLHQARVLPLGALTRGLAGETLTEMLQLSEAGCVAFSQAEVPLVSTQVMLRAFQYASSFGYAVWLRPQELYLGRGVAASGPLATRMGLSGVPVAAETIALHTIFELMKSTGARVHLCRLSTAAGVALVRQAREQGVAGQLRCEHQFAAPHRHGHRLL
jgi:dihydroorotase